VTYYRFYLIDDRERVIGRHEISYASDDAAIAGAAREFPGQNVEIWEGVRCVMTCVNEHSYQSEDALHRPINIVV
jgi:hypothetical protein